MKVFDKPIAIQYKNDETKQWVIYQKLHASINTSSAKERTLAGVSQSRQTLTFEIRFNKAIKNLAFDLQHYRITYDNNFYKLVAYDDFYMQHKTIKIVGESYV